METTEKSGLIPGCGLKTSLKTSDFYQYISISSNVKSEIKKTISE